MLETYLKQCFEEKNKECEQCSQDIKNLQLMKKEIHCEKGKEELLELKKLLKLYEAN